MPVVWKKMTYLLAAAALWLLIMLLFYPAQSLEASLRGISIWWEILFPALLPFLIVSEVMLGFGLVHFVGTLLDPLMRPVFRVPGIGGFVMALGFASGYPVGARLTAQLWEQKLVSREEGERLVAFTTSSDPVFLIGAVSVGFFHSAQLAVIMAVAHYGGAIMIGLLMRFHGKESKIPRVVSTHSTSIILRAFQAMHEARLKDGRPFGLLLRNAVSTSLQMIFVIGGLVVFFSVVMEIFRQSHLLQWLDYGVSILFHLVSIPLSLTDSVVNGLFEVTLGAKAAGEASSEIPLQFKVMLAAFVLSWGGLSVHGQIVSLLYKTDLRYMPFVMARFFHGLVAAVLVAVLWKPLGTALEVWLPNDGRSAVDYGWLYSLQGNLTVFSFILIFLLAAACLYSIIVRITGSRK